MIEEKEHHIAVQEVQLEQKMLHKKEEKLRDIYRTLEKNTYINEKKKQDWIEKALESEDKKDQLIMQQTLDHHKKMDDIKRKQYYRDSVIQRNAMIEEDKKNKTLWKLEKIELKSSPLKGTRKFGSVENLGSNSQASF